MPSSEASSSLPTILPVPGTHSCVSADFTFLHCASQPGMPLQRTTTNSHWQDWSVKSQGFPLTADARCQTPTPASYTCTLGLIRTPIRDVAYHLICLLNVPDHLLALAPCLPLVLPLSDLQRHLGRNFSRGGGPVQHPGLLPSMVRCRADLASSRIHDDILHFSLDWWARQVLPLLAAAG